MPSLRLCRRLLMNVELNRFATRACFVLMVVSTWSWLISIQSKNNLAKTYQSIGTKSLAKEKRNYYNKKIQKTTSAFPNVVDQKQLNLFSTTVIILSSMRSGSSFLGQFFNQNPSVFYFFEPLFPFHDYCDIDQDEKVEVLSSIISCNLNVSVNHIQKQIQMISNMQDESSKSTEHSKRRLHNLEKCRRYSLCFPANTKFLCPAKCQELNNCANCIPDMTRYEVEEKCRQSQLRVVKTVRTCQLSWLERVRDHSAEEMRVIHLVRDPRAVALSRAEMHNFTGNVVKEMKKNCEFDLSAYKEYELRSKMSLPIWTADNYIAVRYEDVLMDPLAFLNTTLEFVNVNTTKTNIHHKNVLTWLEKNTRVSAGSRYSTSRNATEQMFKWRKKANMKLVLDVQIVCKSMMEMFGYVPVKLENDLRNFDVKLLLPFAL